MLIKDNPNALGDKFLSGEESVAKMREDSFRANQKFRLDDQELLADKAQRLGKPMSHTDLIKRVRSITGNRVWAEDSINWPGGMNFYTERNGGKVCLAAAFEKGFLPEFSFIIEDENKLPIKEIRGWRTVIYRLLAARVLTKSQIRRAFGSEPSGDNAVRWQIYTRNFT